MKTKDDYSGTHAELYETNKSNMAQFFAGDYLQKVYDEHFISPKFYPLLFISINM